MRPSMPWQRLLPTKACQWKNTTRYCKWRRTIPTFARKFASACVLRPNSRLSSCCGRPASLPTIWEIGDADQKARQEPYGGTQRRFRVAHLARRCTQDLAVAADDGDRCRRHRGRNLFARAGRSLERITGASDKRELEEIGRAHV